MFSDKYDPKEEEGSYEEALSEVINYQHPWNVDIECQHLDWGCMGKRGGREGGRERGGGGGGRQGGREGERREKGLIAIASQVCPPK